MHDEDHDDDALFGQLQQEVYEGVPGAQDRMDALLDQRAAEAATEAANFAEAFGPQPNVGIVVVDGGTSQRPLITVDKHGRRHGGNLDHNRPRALPPWEPTPDPAA